MLECWNGRQGRLKIFCPVMGVWVQIPLRVHNGDLVQLARTLDLHSRGREFESHILHKKKGSKAVMMSLWGKGLKKG